MRTALTNGRVLTGDKLVSGLTVLVSNGRIEAVVAPTDVRCNDALPVDLGGRILFPGFIHVQGNGGGGALFNHQPSSATIPTIRRTHRRFRPTRFRPSLINPDFPTHCP